MHILYIAGSLPYTSGTSRFTYMSEYMDGDVIVPWGDDRNDETLEIINQAKKHSTFTFYVEFYKPTLAKLKYIVQTGIQLLKKNKYDAIVAYNPGVTGLAGVVLKSLFKVPLITEVMGDPIKGLKFQDNIVSWKTKVKMLVSGLISKVVLSQSTHVRLLYPGQVKTNRPTSSFHDMTKLPQHVPTTKEKFILFMGFPWYLKGVDLLIQAFNLISEQFPDYTLKIVGECLDKTYFEQLTNNNPKIELSDPVYHEEALKLMAHSSLFVLPSRTEAMGRVLLEAMSSNTPVIASNVDGIPFVITDNETGLLFKSGDVTDLANKMSLLLEDKDLRDSLVKNAFRHISENLTPEISARKFYNMIEHITHPVGIET